MHPTLGAATLLDRLAHRRGDAALLDRLRHAREARFMVLVDGKPVIRSNPNRTMTRLAWHSPTELAVLGEALEHALFLGVERPSGAGRFALSLCGPEAERVLGVLTPAVDLRSLASQGVMPSDELSLAGQAKALFHWHGDNRCCGRCGAPTRPTDGGWKRACTACGHVTFPRLDPVVIMLVSDGERCVLAHEPRFPERMYSTLAGFVEPGEDIAAAVRRETREEVGLEVVDVGFHSAQPWPFPHSLMLGCLARARPAELIVDPTEIAHARWLTRAEVGSMLDGTHPEGLWVPGPQAIAHWLIRAFAYCDPATTTERPPPATNR